MGLRLVGADPGASTPLPWRLAVRGWLGWGPGRQGVSGAVYPNVNGSNISQPNRPHLRQTAGRR